MSNLIDQVVQQFILEVQEKKNLKYQSESE